MSSTTRLTVPSTIQYNGYRDPAYLDNVVAEMAAQAVEERDNEGEESSGSDDDLWQINLSEVLMFNAKRYNNNLNAVAQTVR